MTNLIPPHPTASDLDWLRWRASLVEDRTDGQVTVKVVRVPSLNGYTIRLYDGTDLTIEPLSYETATVALSFLLEGVLIGRELWRK